LIHILERIMEADFELNSDTVLNFEMVLANGTIVNANANENPDLYLAQKGGSGNFGVITRFDMKPIHYPDPNAGVYGGMLVYDIDSTPDVFDAYVDFAGAHAEDIHTSVITMLDYSSTTGTHSFMAAPFNTENKHSAAIEKFVQLDGLTSNGLAHGKMSNMLAEADLDRYQIWYTGTYSTCREVMDYIKEGHIKLAADLTAALPEGTYFGLKSEYQPITKTMSSYGENIMGLEPHVENDTGILFLAWVYVETPEAYEISVPLVKAYYEDIEAYATSIGRNWDWLYLAYSNTEQDPISKYGAANIQKLQDVSRKYDPEGVFQHLRGSGFKLPAF
jgi:FAD/FMN-containing dehydrogenase